MNKSVISLLGVAALVAAAAWFWISAAKPAATSSLPTELTKPVLASKAKTTPSKSTLAAVPATPAATSSPSISAEAQRQCREVFALTNATARKAAFDKMLAGITDAAGIKGVLEVMNEMFKSGRRFDAEWDTFWHVIAHRDPKATVALIESYGSKERWYIGAVSRTLQEWASTDPQAAMQWLEGNQAITGKELDHATLNLIYGYAGRDLNAATAYALSVFETKDPSFGHVAYALSSNAVQQGGVTGLLSWFDALPNDAVKQSLFPTVGSRLGEVDREQRKAWLTAEAAKPYRNDQAYRDFVDIMAGTDPKGALEYAFSLPRSPHNGVMTGTGYASFAWLLKDANEFTNYYKALPSAELKAEIVKAINDALRDPNFPNKKRVPGQQFLEAIK